MYVDIYAYILYLFVCLFCVCVPVIMCLCFYSIQKKWQALIQKGKKQNKILRPTQQKGGWVNNGERRKGDWMIFQSASVSSPLKSIKGCWLLHKVFKGQWACLLRREIKGRKRNTEMKVRITSRFVLYVVPMPLPLLLPSSHTSSLTPSTLLHFHLPNQPSLLPSPPLSPTPLSTPYLCVPLIHYIHAADCSRMPAYCLHKLIRRTILYLASAHYEENLVNTLFVYIISVNGARKTIRQIYWIDELPGTTVSNEPEPNHYPDEQEAQCHEEKTRFWRWC